MIFKCFKIKPTMRLKAYFPADHARTRFACRHSMDVPTNSAGVSPYRTSGRRYSVDSLGPLKTIWDDNQAISQFGHNPDVFQAPVDSMPQAGPQAHLEDSLSKLSVQGGHQLQNPTYASIQHQQTNALPSNGISSGLVVFH